MNTAILCSPLNWINAGKSTATVLLYLSCNNAISVIVNIKTLRLFVSTKVSPCMTQNKNIIMRVKSLGPDDAIWYCSSGLTLVLVMACCQTAPGHYLNLCWSLISGVLWHLYESRCRGSASYIHLSDEFVNGTFEFTISSPSSQWVNPSPPCATYMHQWIGSVLVQIMVCRLFGTKPFF